MKEFDVNGVTLATFQAELCATSRIVSHESSPIFLRRLLKSRHINIFDAKHSDLLSLDIAESLNALDEEYGPSEYGSTLYAEDELYWIGWIYRYIAYTREIPSRVVYSYIKPSYLRNLYPVYHTQSEEWCFARILENLGLTEEYFDLNGRVKIQMRGKPLYPNRPK